MNGLVREEQRLHHLKYALAEILRAVVEKDTSQPNNIHEEWMAEDVIKRWEEAGHQIRLKPDFEPDLRSIDSKIDHLEDLIKNVEEGIENIISGE